MAKRRHQKKKKSQRDHTSKSYSSYQNIRIEVVREEVHQSPVAISDANDVFESMYKEVSKLDREHFWILCLNSQNKVIGRNLVSIGTVTASLIHPREVYKAAIVLNSVNIILIHNHPSGDTKPSNEDKMITSKLKEAGELLGINVIDHIIISAVGYYSFLNEGVF